MTLIDARAQPLAVGGGLLREARLEELVHRAAQDRWVAKR
jgi:hypothetical protein